MGKICKFCKSCLFNTRNDNYLFTSSGAIPLRFYGPYCFPSGHYGPSSYPSRFYGPFYVPLRTCCPYHKVPLVFLVRAPLVRESSMMDPVSSEVPVSQSDSSQATPDQLDKIRKDLDVVQSNMSVFSEMLSEVKPDSVSPSDDELLEELFTTCTEMQRRITELLCTITSEELTGEMLHINDELNNLFLRYGRYRKNQEKILQQQQPEQQDPSLIDFGPEDVSRVLGGLKLEKKNGNGNDNVESDSAAKASKPDKGASAKPEGGNEDEILMGHKPSDFDEMEAWLRENPGAAGGIGSEASLTSSEFDKFLSERAAGGPKGGNNNSSTEKR